MTHDEYVAAMAILKSRFCCDTCISLATVEANRPCARIVNGYYEDGCFYVITHGCSRKMQQIAANPHVAVCCDWFNAHGIGENIGHPRDTDNAALMEKLRDAFSAWYDNGHTDENDPNICILRIRLTDGILLSRGTPYNIDFENPQ